MGPVLLIIAMVLLIVGFLMSGAIAAAVWGRWLSADADSRHEGSELIGLNS